MPGLYQTVVALLITWEENQEGIQGLWHKSISPLLQWQIGAADERND